MTLRKRVFTMENKNEKQPVSVTRIVLTVVAALIAVAGVIMLVKGIEGGIVFILVGVLLLTRNVGMRRSKR